MAIKQTLSPALKPIRVVARTVTTPAMRAFLAGEAGSGALLILAAALALLVVNAVPGGAGWYHDLIHQPVWFMDVHHWINDGLMAVFFLVVGLEIKREWLDGRLSSWQARRLPIIAAVAGMAVPALVYLSVTTSTPGLAAGWAIPAATDIAFALGILALLGSRVPTSLKLFLTTVAIVDDMGAVAIIALVYIATIDLTALGLAFAALAAMVVMNRMGVRAVWPYIAGFLLAWGAMLASGVHATVAGVLAAFTVPIVVTPGAPDHAGSPLHRMEHGLHPWSAYLIVPVFGFVNAGVHLPADIGAVTAPLPLGVALGLFLGKQFGIAGAIALSVRLGIATMPRGATWAQLYGLALLCGIGFTMSLFIGELAFKGAPLLAEEAKLGILAGSLLSALGGLLVLRFAPRHPDHDRIEAQLCAEIDADGDERA